MLVLTQVALRRGSTSKVNMVGRWAVWPTMFSMFLAMVSVTWVAEALLYLGLAMTLWATALYVRDGFAPSARQESCTLKRNLTSRLYSPTPRLERTRMDTFPDLGALSDQELKDLIQQLTEEEQEVSLPAPHPARQDRHPARGARQPPAQEARGGRAGDHGRGRPAAHGHPVGQGHPRGQRRVGPQPAVHCPECGFVNAEGANYCQKCGAFLAEAAAAGGGDTTEAYQLDETGELRPVDLERVTGEGATLVIRSGGGRAGEIFNVERGADDDRPQPGRRGLPRRRDRLAQPRAARAARATASTSTTSARSTAPT